MKTLYMKRINLGLLIHLDLEKKKKLLVEIKHELWIKKMEGEWNRYALQRGFLREIALAAEKKGLSLLNKLYSVNPAILFDLLGEGINTEKVEKSFIKAYEKDNLEFEKYLSKKQKNL